MNSFHRVSVACNSNELINIMLRKKEQGEQIEENHNARAKG